VIKYKSKLKINLREPLGQVV